MLETITQRLAGIGGEGQRYAILFALKPVADRLACQATASAGLLVSATVTRAKTGAAAFAGTVQGVPVAIAAGVDMPVLTGLNISANAFNIICFFIDRAGVVTAAMGTEGTSLGLARFPQFPEGRTLVGYLVVTNATAFVGGTTSLVAATVVYVSPTGAFDPTVII